MSGEKQKCGELVGRIAAGDRCALGELYDQMKSKVYGFALAILRNRSDAEDILQNTFLHIWDGAGGFRNGTDAEAWVMTITRNLAMDRFRQQKNMTDIMDAVDTLEGEDEFSPRLDRMLLNQLLSELDCSERQIVMLHAVGGYSHREIAHIVGRPCATVRWKYSNAMKKLQLYLKKEDSYEDGKKVQFAGSNCEQTSLRG